jgi:hypothetical protein
MHFKHLVFFIGILFINACQTQPPITDGKADISLHALNHTVAATYAKNGRLWRLIPSEEFVYIDYSDDNGKSYSHPSAINRNPQKISAWPENPPAISIGKSGRINVLYYADANQKSTSYFSYSDDNGQTFSTPDLISDHADDAMHYMDKMVVDKNDNVYLFWHDLRHQHTDKHHGSGVLSLYYTMASSSQKDGFTNHFISSAVCSCCRTATALDNNDKPVVLMRMVFSEGARDHGLIRMNQAGQWLPPKRITHDNWKIEACPEHGPALAIDSQNRSHLTWFTLGDTRQGIYYAQTDDFGVTVSDPVKLGTPNRLASHPDVISLNNRVVLAWKEFDGEQTTILTQESLDRGVNWSSTKTLFTTHAENGHPALISNGNSIFLSWVATDIGHQLKKI